MMLFLFDQYCQRLVNFITFFEELTLDLLILSVVCLYINLLYINLFLLLLFPVCGAGLLVIYPNADGVGH